MQTKDIPDIPVLQFLDSLKDDTGTWFDNEGKLFEPPRGGSVSGVVTNLMSQL